MPRRSCTASAVVDVDVADIGADQVGPEGVVDLGEGEPVQGDREPSRAVRGKPGL